MTEKIKVSKEVAEAIEKYIHYWTKEIGKTKEEVKALLVGTHNELKYKGWDAYRDGSYKAMEGISTFDLMQVLVNGYEVEMTPHEQLINSYTKTKNKKDVLQASPDTPSKVATINGYRNYMEGIRFTLDVLGITIKGINN